MTESFYGQIKLKCPYKHELGAILVQPRKPVRPQTFHRLATVLSAPDLSREQPEVIETQGPIDVGAPVVAKCERCGRTWQTPWEMVIPEIRKLADTPMVTLTLFDPPLC